MREMSGQEERRERRSGGAEASVAARSHPWSDELAARIGAILGPFWKAELPWSTQHQLLQVAATAWNLSRLPAAQRPFGVEGAQVEEALQPLLHELAERCAARWPHDPRFIRSAELSSRCGCIEIRASARHPRGI